MNRATVHEDGQRKDAALIGAAHDAQEIARRLGRQQLALEVLLWIRSHAGELQQVRIESLLALCNRELRNGGRE